MTELEKKAYDYAIERQKDPNYPTYNWETEITDAYEKGYRDAIEKACKWLEERQLIDLEVPNIDKFISEFKKAMEE